eukprot:4942688-Amphidinium_carterae.1
MVVLGAQVQVAIQTVVATMLRIPASAVTVLADKTRRLSSKLGAHVIDAPNRRCLGLGTDMTENISG